MGVVKVAHSLELDDDFATDDEVDAVARNDAAAVTNTDCDLAIVADAPCFELKAQCFLVARF
jgi:hypothetical protein